MNGSPFSRTFRVAFACVLTAAVLLPPSAAEAQDTVPITTAAPANNTAAQKLPDVTLDFRNAPIREALEQLFRSAKADYSLDATVTGFITLSVIDQPFENALNLFINSASTPLKYTREGNVYIVKPLVAPTSNTRPLMTRRFVPVVPTNSARLTIDDQQRVSFNGTAPIRSLLMQLMQQNGPEGTPYIIAPQVTGDLTITFDKVPFDIALKYLLSNAEPNLTYKKENNVYIFEPQKRK